MRYISNTIHICRERVYNLFYASDNCFGPPVSGPIPPPTFYLGLRTTFRSVNPPRTALYYYYYYTESCCSLYALYILGIKSFRPAADFACKCIQTAVIPPHFLCPPNRVTFKHRHNR